MRATGVTSRFLALLDVTLILLGILMLSLAQIQESASAGSSHLPANRESKQLSTRGGGEEVAEPMEVGHLADFVFVFAGTAGTERGRCYLMDRNGKRLQEIRTDSDSDIHRIIESQSAGQREAVVMLLISSQGFDWMWSPELVHALAKTWGVNVVPVYRWK